VKEFDDRCARRHPEDGQLSANGGVLPYVLRELLRAVARRVPSGGINHVNL